MTPQQIVGTAIRLMALWFAANSAKYLIAIPIALTGAKLGDNAAYSYSTGVTFLALREFQWDRTLAG